MPYKDPKKRARYHKNYRAAHREEAKAYASDYRKTRRATARKATKAWRLAHPGYTERYYRANWKRERARSDKWYREHPEEQRAKVSRRRARIMNAPGAHHTAAERADLFKSHKGRCAYCGRKATTLDHVIPLARGGSNSISNCLPACKRCNFSKGSKLISEWRNKFLC